VVEPRRIARERVGGELGDAEGIVPVGDDVGGDAVGALADQALVGAVDEGRAKGRVGRREKGGDARGLQLHVPSALRRMKTATRSAISRPSASAASSRALCSATVAA